MTYFTLAIHHQKYLRMKYLSKTLHKLGAFHAPDTYGLQIVTAIIQTLIGFGNHLPGNLIKHMHGQVNTKRMAAHG